MNLFRKKPGQPLKQGKLISIDSFDPDERKIHAIFLAQTAAENDLSVEHIELQPPVLDDSNLNPRAAAIFFAIEQVKQANLIREALTLNDIVIVEGYVITNAGYCGAYFSDHFERVDFFKWVDNLSFTIFNMPRTNLNIIISPENATKKANPVSESFKELAKLAPNTKIIEYVSGKNARLETRNKIWELVRRIALQTNIVKTK
ncbi:MAG: hypothetical protein IT410_00725 [Candidatus Doudnabacteria bacterium]|nr:hypothetical protein [Candidatus Doudnabacteria bacterium]